MIILAVQHFPKAKGAVCSVLLNRELIKVHRLLGSGEQVILDQLESLGKKYAKKFSTSYDIAEWTEFKDVVPDYTVKERP